MQILYTMKDKDLFLQKFEEKLRKQLDSKTLNSLSNSMNFDDDMSSIDYDKFRLETLPSSMGFYEKLCNFCEKIMPINPDKKTKEEIEKHLYAAHLNCSATGVQSTAIFFPLLIIILGLFFLLFVSSTIGFGLIMIGLGMYFAMLKVPAMLEKRLKAKANDQIIIAIFYIVAFMRFNSNFELAINFAANYLNPPLSLDFKRILWQLENSEFPNIKQAMDKYLEGWRDKNLEFLESIYLIESSLYESDNIRRISLLDKSLDIILQGNYEKMLHFAQELRGKVTTFNMMGVVLPILGLIILPLAASFGDPKSTWEFVLLLYNLIIPVLVGYFGFILTFNRPSTVNSIKTPKNIKGLEQMQKYPLKISSKKTIYVSPKVPALIFFVSFLILGFSPILIHNFGLDDTVNQITTSIFGENSVFSNFLEYREINKDPRNVYDFGPYGPFPGILSLFIPLSIAYGAGIFLKSKYKALIHLRDATKKLELQFPSAMFQLGNRINEGMAAELAFGAVADTMKGTEAGNFFSQIDALIKFDGLSVEKAIFDNEKGAIHKYPSDLIQSSMKILIHATEKGPDITAKTLIDLSRYLSEIHMGSERMKDLLAESLSSMKGQASFLGPIISAVVVSIVSLVTMIMGVLSKATSKIDTGDSGESFSSFMGESIPTFLFQSVVGIYIVILIAILVYVVVNLESGEDPILTKYEIGTKMIGGMKKYAIIVAIGILGFTYIGAQVLESMI